MNITKSAALESLSRCLGRKLTGEQIYGAECLWKAETTFADHQSSGADQGCYEFSGEPDTGVFTDIYGARRQVVAGKRVSAGRKARIIYIVRDGTGLRVVGGNFNGFYIAGALAAVGYRLTQAWKYHDNGDRIVRQVGPVEFAVATVRAGDLELVQ